MYWIQEMGQASGNVRADYKLFYCDYASDINKLPTKTNLGTQNIGNRVLDESYNALCKAGDQCLCLDNSKVYTLGFEVNSWKEM